MAEIDRQSMALVAGALGCQVEDAGGGRVVASVLPMAAFRKPAPVKLPESFLEVAHAFGIPIPVGPPTHYRIRRYRGDAAVEVRFPGGLTVNVTHFERVQPANFAEARKWVAAWSQRHGFEMTEVKMRLHELDVGP